MRSGINKLLRKGGIGFIILLCMFLFMELVLRLLGFSIPQKQVYQNEPRMSEADEVLGWHMIPGSYKIAPYDPSEDSVLITFIENGRITRNPNDSVGKDKVLFIGGSFTAGWGLNDDQNFIWNLQKRFPQFDMHNLGVGGYGGYQSLLVLESEMKNNNKPKIVIYGRISHHRMRDVAQSDWLELMHNSSRNEHYKLPYVTLGSNETIIRNKPISTIYLPFARNSVAINMFQRTVLKISAHQREGAAIQLSRLVIKEMHQACQEVDAAFYVADFDKWDNEYDEQIQFFEKNEINYIDCIVELTEANTVKGDGHPDESVHNIWAERIGARLIKDGLIRED